MGMICGALAAEARLAGTTTWGQLGDELLRHGEDLLAGRPLPIDLTPVGAIAAAVHLHGQPVPLLTDQSTVDLIVEIDDFLAGVSPSCATADFDDVVLEAGSDPTAAVLAGARHGLVGGIGALPARTVSELGDAQGRRHRRWLSALTSRLLGHDRPPWYDPRNRRGPREVLPGVWVANIYAVARFMKDHPEGLVISLCDPEGVTDGHPHRLDVHLDDSPDPRVNPNLTRVLDDVLSEVAGARAADQPVLVHCRHGASRTGLVLRLLLIEELELDAEDALVEAQCLWPHTSTWNRAWAREVDRRASDRVSR